MRLHRAVGPVALILSSLAIALACGELLLRLAGYSRPPLLIEDPVRGFALRPNTRVHWRTEGNSLVETNSAGFHDVEHRDRKPPGTFRVAVLGDSFAEALQVPIDSTFWKRLEGLLAVCLPGRRVEVLNFGVSGYGTAQELLTYRTSARRYHPDLVLLAVTPTNDVRDNSIRLTAVKDESDPGRNVNDPRRQRPFFVLDSDALRLDTTFRAVRGARERWYRLAADVAAHSRLLQLAWDTRKRLRSDPNAALRAGAETGLDVEVYKPSVSADWENAWAVTAALIGQLDREVERDSGRLVVATLSQGIQVHPDSLASERFMRANGITDLFYPDSRIRDSAKALGIAAITLAPELRRYALQSGKFLHGFSNTPPGSGHWNSEGHRAAAMILRDSLCALLRQ